MLFYYLNNVTKEIIRSQYKRNVIRFATHAQAVVMRHDSQVRTILDVAVQQGYQIIDV